MKELLLAGAGRTVPEAIVQAMASAFPEYEIRTASAFQMETALDWAARRRVRDLLLQPVLLTPAQAYRRVQAAAGQYAGRFSSLRTGAPLLDTEADLEAVAGLLADIARPYGDGETAVCFVGHGSGAQPDAVYAALQTRLAPFCRIGLLHGRPGAQEVLARIRTGPYRRAVLHPLLLAAGAHAARDIAGDGETAWRAVFARGGYSVECVMRGLGEYGPVRDLFAAHAKAAAETAPPPPPGSA